MFNIHFLILPLIGFIIGFYVSIVGGGGGGLYVPTLILLGINPQTAVATSLATVLPTTVVGAYSHHKQGHVDIHLGIILGIGGIIGTIIGSFIANMISATLLKKLLGIILLIMIIPVIYKSFKDNKSDTKIEKKNRIELKGIKKIVVPLFGVSGGILAGIFGLSGSLPIQVGLYALDLSAITVIGTTIFVLIFNSIAGIGSYVLLGTFDITLVLLLCSGTIIGAILGPRLLSKINPTIIEKALPFLMTIISIMLGLSMLI